MTVCADLIKLKLKIRGMKIFTEVLEYSLIHVLSVVLMFWLVVVVDTITQHIHVSEFESPAILSDLCREQL